jgi:hypothetical protein
MPIAKVGDRLKTLCKAGTVKGKDQSVAESESLEIKVDTNWSDLGITNLSEFISGNSHTYAKGGASIVSITTADGRKTPKDADIPFAAKNIWWKIAIQIAWSFNEARKTGRPKDKGAVKFGSSGPPIPPFQGTIPPINGVGDAAKWITDEGEERSKNIANAIYKWFEENYKEACAAGTTRNASTEPGAKKATIDAIKTNFNTWWNGAKFTPSVPVPVPNLLKPGNASPKPEYVPGCIAHKGKEGTEGELIGPYETNEELIELSGQVELTDGGNKQKVPKYRRKKSTDPQKLDENEFMIDSPDNQVEIASLLGAAGYKTFKRNKKNILGSSESTGFPIDGGKEVRLPNRNQSTGEIIPGSTGTGVYGLGKNGKPGPNTGNDGGPLKNPNFGKPIPEDIRPNFDDSLPVRLWKNASGNPIVYEVDQDKGLKFGNTRSNTNYGSSNKDEPVTNEAVRGKDVKDSSTGETWNDPTSWGPWTQQDRKGTGEDKDVWKSYLVPGSGFSTAKGKDISGTQNPNRGNLALPKLNRIYWGLLIEELFPDKSPAEAFSALQTDAGGLPDAGSMKDGAKYISGPAPPLKVQAKKPKSGQGAFTWPKTVLYKSGKVGRSDGKEFKRGSTSTNPISVYNTIGAHINDATNGVRATIDAKIPGTAKGGMLFFAPGKQIIFPYTPPTGLKPFQPNTKTYKWE